jgi:hypothetical protein
MGSHPGPASYGWWTKRDKASCARRPSGLQQPALLLPAALCIVDEPRRQIRLAAEAAVEVMLVQ